MKIKRLAVNFIALMIGVVLVLPSSHVRAEANPVIEFTSNTGLSSIKDAINKESRDCKNHPFNFISVSSKNASGYYTITINKAEYSNDDVSNTERQNIMKTALSVINKDSSMSKQSRIRLYNFIAKQDVAVSSLVRQLSTDVSADFATAYSWFKPFSGGISTVLGLLALAIFSLLGLTIMVDLSYIAFAPLRLVLDPASGEKPKIISNEAYSAIKEAEKDSTKYRDTAGIYLKHKIGQIIIVGICLLYLVGGKIYVLVGWFIDSFQSILP